MDLMLGHVPAPPAQPRTIGALLAAAIPGQDQDGTDWHKGAYMWPESFPSWRVAQDCTTAVQDYDSDSSSAPVAARPYVIQTVTHCPRTSIADMVARAERHLRAITSMAVARELWTGAATALDPWTLPAFTTDPFALSNPRPDNGTALTGPYLNPYLEGAATMLTAEATPLAAIGAVEAAVGDRIGGGPVTLHVPGDYVFGAGQDLTIEGDRLLTPLGSRVAADAGYPGTGTSATGSELVVYGTGPVSVWLGDVTVYDQESWVVDHATNKVAVWAERPAMAIFDPQTLVGCAVTG